MHATAKRANSVHIWDEMPAPKSRKEYASPMPRKPQFYAVLLAFFVVLAPAAILRAQQPKPLFSEDFELFKYVYKQPIFSRIAGRFDKMCKKMCKFRPVLGRNRLEPDRVRPGEFLH